MKTLDVNNSNLLDSHYSNIVPLYVKKGVQAGGSSKPIGKPIGNAINGVRGAKPSTLVHFTLGGVKPALAPSPLLHKKNVIVVGGAPVYVAPIPPVEPIGSGNTGGAMGGGGGGGDTGGQGDATAKQGDATATEGTSADVDKVFYKSFWYWGIIIGGIGGYLFAKSKNKSLLNFSLLGAVGLGAIGYVVEKVINTPATPVTTVPPTSAETTVPPASAETTTTPTE